jgi:uncharacterized membrane protein YdjX (TVP38/TMEM64 family)
MARRKHLLRVAGLVAVVAALVTLSLVVEPSRLLDPDALRGEAADHPWRASGLFLLAAMGIKLLFVPFTPISLLGGVVFGGALGGTLALAALLGSSVVSFAIGRKLGRGWVEDLVDDEEGKLRFVERLLRRHGLLAVIVLRVVPTLPLSAVNVVLGHSSVSARDFVLGTALGLLPGTLLLAFVGDRALEPRSPVFWLLAGASALLVAGGVLGGVYLRRRLAT